MRLFNIDSSPRPGGGVVLALSGELDMSTAGELERAVATGVDGRPDLVVLDLRELAFLDSSGLRIMLRLQRRVSGNGGRLVLVRGPRRVHRVFELTGAEDELQIVTDPSEVGDRGDVSAGKG